MRASRRPAGSGLISRPIGEKVRRETIQLGFAPPRALGRVCLLALPCCAVAVLWIAAGAVSPGALNGDAFTPRHDVAARLHASADAGDVAGVERALDRVPGVVDAPEAGSGLTPLMTAARAGHVAVVERLLARGADVNASAHGHGTALAIAAWNNRPRVVRVLLAAGADPNIGTVFGHTPLMFAARNCADEIESLNLLLEGGADVDARDARGETAFTFAAASGNRHTVRHLQQALDR
jgi:hypothetical protein